MTAIELRTEIVQMIKDEQDTSVLEAIRVLLYKLRGAEAVDDDLTDEEVAGFNEELAKRDRGEIKFHTEEESIRLIRHGSGK